MRGQRLVYEDGMRCHGKPLAFPAHLMTLYMICTFICILFLQREHSEARAVCRSWLTQPPAAVVQLRGVILLTRKKKHVVFNQHKRYYYYEHTVNGTGANEK